MSVNRYLVIIGAVFCLAFVGLVGCSKDDSGSSGLSAESQAQIEALKEAEKQAQAEKKLEKKKELPDLSETIAEIDQLQADYLDKKKNFSFRLPVMRLEGFYFFKMTIVLVEMMAKIEGTDLDLTEQADAELEFIGKGRTNRDQAASAEVASVRILMEMAKLKSINKEKEVDDYLNLSPTGMKVKEYSPASELFTYYFSPGPWWLKLMKQDQDDHALIAPFMNLTNGMFAILLEKEMGSNKLREIHSKRAKDVGNSTGYHKLVNSLIGRIEVMMAMVEHTDPEVKKEREEFFTEYNELVLVTSQMDTLRKVHLDLYGRSIKGLAKKYGKKEASAQK